VHDDIRGSLKTFISPYGTRRCAMVKHYALGENLSLPDKKLLRDGNSPLVIITPDFNKCGYSKNAEEE
jgi:hypothetical protein